MLNHFPDLLTYKFFAPMLLRVAAGLVLWYVAYAISKNRHTLLETSFPLIGRPPLWLIRAGAAITALVGLALVVGYETQWAAILGALVSIKCCVLTRYYKHVSPLSCLAAALLLVICLSLLFSGAGALAFDLPL